MGKHRKKMRDKLLMYILVAALVLTGISLPNIAEKVQTSEVVLAADHDTAEQLDGVSATVNHLSTQPNGAWDEYNLTITNSSNAAVQNFMIRIPVSGQVQSFQSWGCNASYSDGYVIIRYSSTIDANSSYSFSGDEKFGFSGGGVLGTPEIVADDGTYTSSSELNYELTGQTKETAYEDTPFGQHGKLRLMEVDGYDAPVIVDQYGTPYQLRGASTHGMHWFPEYVNEGSFQSLRDEWGVNMVRLVSYVTQNGYTAGNQALLDSKIQEGVEAATKLGLYVIIDWHIHEENPHTTKSWAETFFQTYAAKYKDYDNVIFEICNEPTGVEWYSGNGGDLYSYCKDICQIIRNEGSDALIVCGTNTWSQDVDDVVKKPLKNDGFENILYTFHFYSGSHYENLMNKVRQAISDGTPIFVTEFGICDASGNGGFDTANADAWIALLDSNNISYACWSLCNKDESASYLSSGCSKSTGGWVASDLATTGIWLINTYRSHQDQEQEVDTSKDKIGDSDADQEGTGSQTGGSTDQGNTGNQTGGSTSQGNTGNQTGGSTSQGNTGNQTGGNAVQDSTGSQTGGKVDQTVDPKGSNVIVSVAEKAILSQKSDKDIVGSTYGTLSLKAVKTTKNTIKLKWNKVSKATGYVIYGNRCGNTNQLKKLATVKSTNWTQKKLKKGTYYKYVVVAYETVSGQDETLSISKTIHAATAGGKKGNAKKIKVNKSKVKLKKGKKFRIKATQVATSKKTKIAKHRAISFESSNRNVATVTSKGMVKAVKKGSCTIYVYAQNGFSKKVKVTVK